MENEYIIYTNELDIVGWIVSATPMNYKTSLDFSKAQRFSKSEAERIVRGFDRNGCRAYMFKFG